MADVAPTDIPDALLTVELERLAASAEFRRSPRQVRLLRYLVEQARAGNAGRLKESSLAIDVFGRGPSSFDGRQDTTVRVEARRLRQRLARYYAGEGAWASVEIELPVGSYVPVLRRRFVNGGAKLPSIAVLPFLNLTGSPDHEHFCEGLTDEITDALAQIPGVKVVARTSAARYRGVSEDVRAIAAALGVATLLEGSVQGERGVGKVVAQWVRGSDGYHAWSRGMEIRSGEGTQAFKERVARDVVAGLQRRLLEQGGQSGMPVSVPLLRRAATVAAQDTFDRARYLLRLARVDTYERAVPLLRQTIAADPRFALAHCVLGRTLLNIVGITVAAANGMLEEARASIGRSLELDPDLGEAHTAQGFIAFAFDHDWARAEPSFLRGIRFAPSLPYAHSAYAWALMFNERFAEADNEYHLARELDPLDMNVRAHHALTMLYAGHDERALAGLDAILEVEPTHVIAHVLRATALLWRGDLDHAAREYQRIVANHPGLTIGEIGLAQTDAEAGRMRAARTRLRRLLQSRDARYFPPYQVAMIHARLGDFDAALDWLDRAAAERDMNFVCTPVDRAFVALRDDPRFGALLARHGLRGPAAATPQEF